MPNGSTKQIERTLKQCVLFFYLKEGDKLNYILMHKDIPVIQLKLDKNTGCISKLGELYSKEHLPLGTSATDRISLNRW